MNLKTSLIVFYSVLFSAMLVIYLGLQWKELFIKIQLGAFKVAFLSLPHFWILRSEEISKYVKRKLNDLFDSYFYQLFFNNILYIFSTYVIHIVF